MKSPFKKLLKLRSSLTEKPPDFPRLPSINTQNTLPIPTLSISLTSQNALTQFLKSHLTPPISPPQLLSFLRNKLHHHPSFTQFDLYVFRWAATIDDFFRHDHSTYEWMARTLAVTDRFDDLNSLLQTVLSDPCPCSDGTIFACPRIEPIFRFALNSFVRAGRLDDAIAAFESVKRSIDGKPDSVLYNILINGFVKHQNHEKALELYRKMLRDGVKPDVFTFNILIGSCCRNLNSDSALGLFREMRIRGCNPNVVSFNTLIRGCFREGKVEKGVGVAHEMLDLGCGFSVATCEILVDGLCRVGRANEASTLLAGFFRKGVIPDGFDCLNLVEVLCREGKTDQALEVLDEFWVSGRRPSVVACTTLIECMRNSGRIDEGSKLLERMLKDGIVPDSVTYNCVVQALCDVGRVMDANRLRVLASSKGLDPDGATFDILVSGFSREGRRREGEGVVDEMLDAGFIPDISTYNRLMDGLQNGSMPIRRHRNVTARYSSLNISVAFGLNFHRSEMTTEWVSKAHGLHASRHDGESGSKIWKYIDLPQQALQPFKIALCQLSVTLDKLRNIAHARNAIESAAGNGAQLVVLPEIWNCPYSNENFPKYAENFDNEDASPSFSMLSEVARVCGITIVGGSIPEWSDGRLYNTCCVFGIDGKLKAKHRKMHLFDVDIPGDITFKESDTLSAGEKPTIVDTDVGRIGLGICHDIRFPELAMLYAARGAQLICYPGAFNMSTGQLLWELMQRARAVDNQFGEVISTTGHEESTVIAEINYSLIQLQRSNLPLEKQRRGDIYQLMDVHGLDSEKTL